MATIAYLRVSTEDQDLDQQRLAILDYAHKHRIAVHEFIATHRSAKHASQSADLMQMIEALQPGDRLIVSELSRLGRSLSQILQIIDRLIQKHVRLVAIKEAIRFEGKHNIQTKAMIALFGLFAEVERDLIAQRTKEGLAAAKARGKRLGRPKGALSKSKLDGKEGEIRSLLQKTSRRPPSLGSWTSRRPPSITSSRPESFSPSNVTGLQAYCEVAGVHGRKLTVICRFRGTVRIRRGERIWLNLNPCFCWDFWRWGWLRYMWLPDTSASWR